MKRVFSFVLLAFFVMQGTAVATTPRVVNMAGARDVADSRPTRLPQTDGESRSLGVIVKARDTSSAPLVAQLLAEVHDTTVGTQDPALGLAVMPTPFTHTAEQFAVQLMLEAPGLAYAEPNYVRHADAYTAPTDPDFNSAEVWQMGSGTYLGGKHWWLTSMEASGAWAIGQGDTYPVQGTAEDIKVAVLDTGFYLSHPEFAAGTVVAGIDECASYNPLTDVLTTDSDVTPDDDPDPEYGPASQSHGTATAASAGAEVNGVGMVGSGWNPKVVGYKVAGPLTSDWGDDDAGDIVMTDLAIANGIYDATDAGCKIISMSLSGPDPSTTLQEAVTYAHSHGVVVCASVGNDGAPIVTYPANCTYVTAVGAVERSGGSGPPAATDGTITRADFSNYGAGMVDLTAGGELFWTAYRPGVDGPGTPPDDVVPGYDFWSGTSFSTPAVAGAIAYIWRAVPNLTNDEVVKLMEDTAVDLGTVGRDNQYGYGLVNMRAAYERLTTTYPKLTKPTITAATYAKPGSSVTWSTVVGYSVNYQVSIDGALRTTQSGTSYALPSMSEGSHLVSILPTSSRNWNAGSNLATKTVIWDSIAPVVSGFAQADESVTWSATDAWPCTVEGYLDSGVPAVLGSNSLSITGLGSGSHSVHVRATDPAGNTSGWVTWSFDLLYPAPTIESVSATDVASVPVSWSAVTSATAYEYQVGSGAIETTTSTGVSVTGLTGGTTPFKVRSVFDGDHRSGWANADITVAYTTGASCALSLSATSRIGYPTTTVALAGSISATSVPVRLQSSADGAIWSDLATITAGAAAPGALEATVTQVRSMRYRLVFAGTLNWGAATSNVVSVAYTPRLTTPSTPSRVKRKAKFYTYSYASAPAANSSAVMTFKFERYQKSGKRYKWVVRKKISTKGSVYTSTSMRYRVRTYMSYTGKWRVKAYYSGAPMYTTATSGYRYFRVR
jgi:hypothetical protein